MESENHNLFNIDFLGKLKKKYINKCKYYYILKNMFYFYKLHFLLPSQKKIEVQI